MPRPLRVPVALAALALAALALLAFWRLSAFGIWDPWELEPADDARRILAGEPLTSARPELSVWLIARAFDLFGVREWAGRAPIALAGLIAVGAAAWIGARLGGARTALYAALVAGTSPLLLFNARHMLGEAPAFAAQGLLGAAIGSLLFGRAGSCGNRPMAGTSRWKLPALGVLAVAAALLATSARGVLLGVLPPVCAAALVVFLDGRAWRTRERVERVVGAVVLSVALLLTVLVARAIVTDAFEYSAWLGGRPRGGQPPSFEVEIEALLHAFAPWSALVPVAFAVAVARVLWPGSEEPTSAIPENAPPLTPTSSPTPPNPAEPSGVANGATDPVQATASRDDGTSGATSTSAVRADALASPSSSDASAPAGDARLEAFLVAWAVLAWGALVLFTSRYGPAAYPAVVALAALVGLLLSRIERSGVPWVAAGIVAVLLTCLLARDHILYPASPLAGLGIDGPTVPEAFEARRAWAVMFVVFAAGLLASLWARPGVPFPDLRAPYRGVRDLWRRGRPWKAWLVLAALLAVGSTMFGLVAVLAGEQLGLMVIVQKVGKLFVVAPPIVVLPAAVAALQLVRWLLGRLGPLRMLPISLAALAFAAWIVLGYQPALSAHLSPREVYDTYNRLAQRTEPLAEYRVGGRAAAYYARGEVRDVRTQGELLAMLRRPDRVWVAMAADELPSVNREFRRATGRHLFVADARSARVVLATNQPVAGVQDQNFLARYVLDRPPRVQFPVGARYEDKIELVGYDLELPRGDHVGTGESFTVTWYWRVLRPVPGGYKVFLHIDGEGNRLNGDHDPVDGRYPVRLWDEGDVVVDTQRLTVPANYRPGLYTMFIGFFSGETRLEVVAGPEDDANRVRAGVLRVR